ncbi:hypothetical protein OHA63_20660 [Streptomyces anulatus]|uniref:hypothetical protein n=1 Tax=Streptomyces anulatus TaxID=1892 RepID=UPI002E30C930|nr:hypothetical protein [Streptomyces anulatus]
MILNTRALNGAHPIDPTDPTPLKGGHMTINPTPSRRRIAALLLTGTLALAACGGGDENGDGKGGDATVPSKKPGERHTVLLEVTSDYGRPVAINYFGHATGPDGMKVLGEKDGELTAESPWKTTLTVEGENVWVSLMANGTGCLGRAIGGDSCETGAIPNREDFQGTGTTTCRITIDGKVVVEKSYTWPTVIPVTCLTPLKGKAGEGR